MRTLFIRKYSIGAIQPILIRVGKLPYYDKMTSVWRKNRHKKADIKIWCRLYL